MASISALRGAAGNFRRSLARRALRDFRQSLTGTA
jgi:hypothetical protein